MQATGCERIVEKSVRSEDENAEDFFRRLWCERLLYSTEKRQKSEDSQLKTSYKIVVALEINPRDISESPVLPKSQMVNDGFLNGWGRKTNMPNINISAKNIMKSCYKNWGKLSVGIRSAIIIGVFTVASAIITFLGQLIAISISQEKEEVEKEIVIVEGKVYDATFTQLLEDIKVVVIDESAHPISRIAITGTDGRFIIKTHHDWSTRLFLLVQKGNRGSQRVPLDRHKLKDLKIRFIP